MFHYFQTPIPYILVVFKIKLTLWVKSTARALSVELYLVPVEFYKYTPMKMCL